MTIYCNMVMIHIVSSLLGNNYYRKCIELLYSYFEVLMLISQHIYPDPSLLLLLILPIQNNKSVIASLTCDVRKNTVHRVRSCAKTQTFLCLMLHSPLDPTPHTVFSVHHPQLFFNIICDLPSKNQHSLHLRFQLFNSLSNLLGKTQFLFHSTDNISLILLSALI